jgi:hypothetical protein
VGLCVLVKKKSPAFALLATSTAKDTAFSLWWSNLDECPGTSLHNTSVGIICIKISLGNQEMGKNFI